MDKPPSNARLWCLGLAFVFLVLLILVIVIVYVPRSEGGDTSGATAEPPNESQFAARPLLFPLLASPAYAQSASAFTKLAGVKLDPETELPCAVICEIATARQNWNKYYGETAHFDDWRYLGWADLTDQAAIDDLVYQLESGAAPAWFSELDGNTRKMALLVNEMAAADGMLMPSLDLKRVILPPSVDAPRFSVAGKLAYLPAPVAAETFKVATPYVARLASARDRFPVLNTYRVLEERRIFTLTAEPASNKPIIDVSDLEMLYVPRLENGAVIDGAMVGRAFSRANMDMVVGDLENGAVSVSDSADGDSDHGASDRGTAVGIYDVVIEPWDAQKGDLESVYVIELSWLAGTDRRTTLCLADDQGILYDSMLSNAALLHFDEGSFMLRFGWPWESPGGLGCPGYTRGWIKVDATPHGAAPATVWTTSACGDMNLGEAKAAIIEERQLESGGYYIKYSYAWATGFKSIKLNVAGSGFEIVGMLGTGGTGEGSFVEQ